MPLKALLVLAGACLAHSWTVLPDTDWSDDCGGDPYGKGKDASDCADQCQARRDCAAVSWNGPDSDPHDGACNFKCDLKGKTEVEGEEGVIVRKGYHGFNLRSVPSRRGLRANLCNVPPPAPVPPTPKTLCPAGKVPADWIARCESADIAFSDTLDDPLALLPEVGNGFVATVVTSDTIFAAGVFNGDAVAKRLDASMRARIPPLETTVSVGGAEQKGVRMMDFELASFTQRANFTGGDAGDATVSVEETFYAHAVHRNLLVHEITISASASASAARVATERRRLGGDNGDGIVVQIGVSETDKSDDFSFQPVASARDDEYAISGTTKIAEVNSAGKTGVGLAANRLPANVTVAPGGAAVKLYALHAVVTSLENNATAADLGTAALAQLRSFVGQEGASMRSSHEAAWRARHGAGHIEVDGDQVLAHAVNASLYYIRASIREDWAYGLSPGGLASNGYYGHTFWDQETWMWPPLLMLDPGCAKSALQYRFDRLPGARIKAKACGKQGHSWCPKGYKAPAEAAMFPWESASTGQEVQFSGGDIGVWGQYEIHITGDIALAVRQYWYTTQDKDWLREVGFPLVNATASFYAARASPSTKKHNASAPPAYDILQVMGPDEYAVPVDNSAYTNAVARIALDFAAEAAAVLGESVPDKFANVSAGLSIEVADTVPGRKDLKGGYHPEYKDFPSSSGGAKHPTVKQADAIMLSYPLGVEMNQTVLANDLSFYDGITDPDGPAMTWAMFAIGWFNAGNFTASQGHFQRGYANVQMPYGVWTETPDGGTVNFITGAGGFLQSLVFGTSGMRIEKDQLTFKPPPPSAAGTKASRLVLHSFHFRGSRLRQEVTKSTVVYELLGADENAGALTVACGDAAPQPLVAGKPVSFDRAGTCSIAPASHL